MRVLVTRPAPEAEETAARIVALGHEAIVHPVTRIELLPSPMSVSRPAAIAVTSRNAVRALETWNMAPGLRGVPLFAVGEATAAAAVAAGFTKVTAGDGDGAALARLVVSTIDRRSGPVLYPAAVERSGAFESALETDRYRVDIVEAYRARPVEAFDGEVLEGIRKREIDAAMFHSRRSAEVFRSLLAEEGMKPLNGLVALVLSLRIATALAGTGVTIRVAERPEETALLDLLRAGG
jgi:uroporphyrinogen-III synthase